MKYTATYVRDRVNDAWLVRFEEEPRCHTYGKSLRQARENLLQAIELWFDDVKPEDVVDAVAHGPAVDESVARAAEARRAFEDAERRHALAIRDAVHAMNRAGYSLRDIGEVLGVSHQRAQQLSQRFRLEDLAGDLGRSVEELRSLVRDEYARVFDAHVPADWDSVDDRTARWLYARFGRELPVDGAERRANEVGRTRGRAAKSVKKPGRSGTRRR